MSNRNLLLNPCWDSNDLGHPLPDSPHAVSVALPKWKDVINYEEKDPECLQALRAIYPRFGLNPLVLEVALKVINQNKSKPCNAWPFPNILIAKKAKNFCQRLYPQGKTSITEFFGLQCLITDLETSEYAKAFWQHTGLGASSRLAAIALGKLNAPSPKEGENARDLIKARLADIYCCMPSNIELHPSGMAALTNALEAINKIRPKKPTLQLGFPYVDVLKLPQMVFFGSDLLLETDTTKIEKILDKKQPSAIILELPSNPMLKCIDLKTISLLAHNRGIPVISDDTIGSSININALPYSDLIFTSLTKSFAGKGDILAGAIIINPNSLWAKELTEILINKAFTQLSNSDAIALEKASRDVKKRIPKLNQACLTLKHHLESHPEVSRVLHPESCSNFQSLMKPNGGYGCLLSFELYGGLAKAKKVYDSLEVCKGPSLGTNFTLVCPYVLLAHYKELLWAEGCGVPAHLLRVSVGLEHPDELWARFEKALNQ